MLIVLIILIAVVVFCIKNFPGIFNGPVSEVLDRVDPEARERKMQAARGWYKDPNGWRCAHGERTVCPQCGDKPA